MIYTTKVIELVNMNLLKISKNRGSFSSENVLLKLFSWAIDNISRKGRYLLRDCKAGLYYLVR